MMITITEIVTLKFTVYSGFKIRILGQLLTNRKSSSGSRANDSRHKTCSNWQLRVFLLAFCSYSAYIKKELHSNAWLTMKWKFHHIALLVTSKLTSRSPLSQNARGFTECSFKLDSAEFYEEKARVLYFQCLFF